MGIRKLETYGNYTRKLTDNDKKGLKLLVEKEQAGEGADLEVLLYMQEKGVKLEQEAIRSCP